MSISASILPEFDQEMANLRRTLERVPDDKFAFKPHPKSSSMGWLANHLSNLPHWALITIQQDGFEASPEKRMQEAKSTAEVLAVFDKNIKEAREAIAGASDEHLMKNWTLSAQGKQILSMPRVACLRSFVMNHMIHHRAQLAVYLRLNDLAVPALYGPSADEGSF